MYAEQPKKLLILNVLDILRRRSDENHRLSQKQIADLLSSDCNMRADRKAIRRSLLDLVGFGFDIEYSETPRSSPNPRTGKPEDTTILSDFYLRREFADSELRLLIDGLLFSRHVPYSQCRALIAKLERLSSDYFRSRVRHIATMPDDKTDNKQVFLNIELLDEAIESGHKVRFRYSEYGTDKKMRPRRRADGSVRDYVVSPYQMAANDGRYYLICNHDKYDTVANYRLDRILDLEILSERVRPFETLDGAGRRGLDLAKYMKERVYMFTSRTARVRFRAARGMVSDIIDMFGKGVRFSDEDESGVTVSVQADLQAMEQFAKSYAPNVRVLAPRELADKVQADLREALERYGNEAAANRTQAGSEKQN